MDMTDIDIDVVAREETVVSMTTSISGTTPCVSPGIDTKMNLLPGPEITLHSELNPRHVLQEEPRPVDLHSSVTPSVRQLSYVRPKTGFQGTLHSDFDLHDRPPHKQFQLHEAPPTLIRLHSDLTSHNSSSSSAVRDLLTRPAVHFPPSMITPNLSRTGSNMSPPYRDQTVVRHAQDTNRTTQVVSSPKYTITTNIVSPVDSGYSSTASTGSISEQTGNLVGATMATLDLVNGCQDTRNDAVFSMPDDTYGPDNAHSIISSFLDENRTYTELAKVDHNTLTPLINANIPLESMDYEQPNFPTIKYNEIETETNYFANDAAIHQQKDEGFQDQTVHPSVIVRAPYIPETNLKEVKDKKKRTYSRKEPQKADEGQVKQREGLSRPPPHVLPPCKVCGIQATGFHYGVNTCEACKGFYRRSIIRKSPYICANNPTKCMISPGKRKTCPSCRYKKCQEAGMSVDGIKIGRYTYAKRTQDILELKHTESELSPKQEDLIADQDDDIYQDQIERSPDMPIAQTKPVKVNQEVVDFINIVLQANDMKYPESLKSTTLVEQIQDQIKDQHMNGELPPQINQISIDQFANVLKATGVHLDNRMQVLQQWVVLLNDALRYVVNFAKEIPGFKDLGLSDQMSLIKHSVLEVWLIGRYKAFHKDLNYFTMRNGMTIDVLQTLGEEFGVHMITVSRRLRKLDLTTDEAIMLKAMVMFFTDRCELENPDHVTGIRDRILEGLLFMLNQRRANTAINVGRLIAILTELRTCTEMYQEYTKKITTMGLMDIPPLLAEVMTFT